MVEREIESLSQELEATQNKLAELQKGAMQSESSLQEKTQALQLSLSKFSSVNDEINRFFFCSII